MPGATQQGISGGIGKAARSCRSTLRVFEYLGRSVGVGRGQRQSGADPALQLNFCALSERLFQVEELVLARWSRYRLNLIMEKIVEVGCVQGPTAGKQFLFEAGFEGPRAFRQQAMIRRVAIGEIAESFVEGGFHESRGVGKTQAGTGKDFSAAQCKQSKCNPRHSRIAINAAVDETAACDRRG